MEAHLNFDEEYHFASQLISCASSSSGSFSTASTCSGPHTPVSGRSTPQRRHLSMDHESLTSPTRMGYELATPNSTLNGYFPPEIKSDFQPLEYEISTTPCRKGSMQAQPIEFDYAHMFHSLPPQHQAIDSVNSEVLGNVNYHHHILASPFAPGPGMSSNVAECDGSSEWPMGYFGNLERHDHAAIYSRDLGVMDKRRTHVDESQYKSAALHRAQRLQRASAKRAKREQDQLFPRVIKSGTHNCPYPECISRKAFKRSEHLKRHIESHHNPKFTQCPFCVRKFNRKDNWLQHIRLHTLRDRTVKRTPYHPGAQALYDEEKRKNKSRSQTKRKKALKSEDDDE